MEVFKKYLNSLPKISFDVLGNEFEEGDTIYRIVGNERDFGNMNVMKNATGTHGGLSYFLVHPKTEEIEEKPIDDWFFLLYNIKTSFEQIRKNVNIRYFPLFERDKTQRKLAIQKGELIIRYILQKKNGTQYELLT